MIWSIAQSRFYIYISEYIYPSLSLCCYVLISLSFPILTCVDLSEPSSSLNSSPRLSIQSVLSLALSLLFLCPSFIDMLTCLHLPLPFFPPSSHLSLSLFLVSLPHLLLTSLCNPPLPLLHPPSLSMVFHIAPSRLSLELPSSSFSWLLIGSFDSSITNQHEVDLLDSAMIARRWVCVCVRASRFEST